MSDLPHSDHGDDARGAVSLGPGLPEIPERLPLAHARGEVLFICGAGISRPAGLPDFRELVRDVYLRRRIVPYLIYDAARVFHLVLVGYSANDPPMRYLLNAVAADGARFSDLKERFTFVGSGDPVELEDWKARGITLSTTRLETETIPRCETRLSDGTNSCTDGTRDATERNKQCQNRELWKVRA